MTVVIDYTETRLAEFNRGSAAIASQHIATAPLSNPDDKDTPASAAMWLDEWLGEGLSLLRSLREIESRYAAAIAAGTIVGDPAVLLKLHAMFEQWHSVAARLIEVINAFETAGGKSLDNAAEFRTACDEGVMPGLSADRVRRAASQRHGRSLGETVDAIRRRVV
jgi:hypothetical protein